MKSYNDKALYELEIWKNKMKKKPSIIDKASKGVQNKFDSNENFKKDYKLEYY